VRNFVRLNLNYYVSFVWKWRRSHATYDTTAEI
jgi:hypothetical protein